MNKLNIVSALLLTAIAAIFLGIIYFVGRTHVESPNSNIMYTMNDSIMLEGRHMGYVNLNKFIELAKKLPPQGTFTETDYSIDDDSIKIIVKDVLNFYGPDGGIDWIFAYKNIPISISDNGFSAAVKEIDSVQYMYIPYQILSVVAARVKPINQNSSGQSSINNTPSVITIRDRSSLPAENSSVGKKIQTEGWVLKNVVDILSKYQGLSQNVQMKTLWKFADDNWNYVHDPAGTKDTWRSASETIENFYLVNGKCYTGDCDDFAILMASFARQIGYKSRLVTAFNSEGGHAYAEFYDPDKKMWIPLDWFSKEFGGKPFDGRRYKVYTDL